MRIVVCVKQVPELSELSLDPSSRRLVREGVPAWMNPFDRRAMLEATRLRAELGGSIAALTMGPPSAEAVLRECLALGADRAVHLCDPALAGADTLATARALARAIEAIGFDLVLAGLFSIDSETGQVGPELAALLDVPVLSGVRRLEAAALGERAERVHWRLSAECQSEDGSFEVSGETPAVATCTDRWLTRVPRVLPDEERAARSAVERWGVAELGGTADAYGAAGSPTWVGEIRRVEVSRRRRLLAAEDDAALDRAIDAVLEELASAAVASRGSLERPRHRSSAAPAEAVWVVGEHGPDGGLRRVTRELLAAADGLAAALDTGIAVFLLEPRAEVGIAPPAGAAALAGELGRLGADVLLTAPWLPQGVGAEVSAVALSAAIAEHRPRIVLGPATALGREVLPAVAARLGLGLTGDAIGVSLDAEGRLEQLKPAFGGQVVAPVLSRTRPEMATLRPGVLPPLVPELGRPAARLEALGRPRELPRSFGRVRFAGELDVYGRALDGAALVVCAGYGLGRDAVPRAAELARALGGALGATRRVCDAGWLPRQLQIGISGRSVSPSVYLGLGVRGSFNHVVGMQRSGTVVAVNRDAEAEMLASADLAVLADAPAFVSRLLKRVGAPSREGSSRPG